MFGIIIAGIATFFNEIATAIGKYEVSERKESVYTMGFLNMFWAALIFFGIALFIRKTFAFSLESLPTFSVRAFLEVLQAHVAILAITTADRSTFSFIRTITIPLLLVVDIILGYSITTGNIIGIIVIALGFLILFINHGIQKRGAWLVLFTAINAVATLSLYKYDITYFNSIEAEQGLMTLILMFYFFGMAYFSAKENPFSFFKKRIFFGQSISSGIASIISSFAYGFAPASIITAASRSFEIFWAIISGKKYFHEKSTAVKFISMFFIIIGLFLLAYSIQNG
ncbi:MAG: hypothetical protein HYT28_00305 [Parcubacteria group bacterium]|nr:hypothetical protein [Parcubacteria group bacterium]